MLDRVQLARHVSSCDIAPVGATLAADEDVLPHAETFGLDDTIDRTWHTRMDTHTHIYTH